MLKLIDLFDIISHQTELKAQNNANTNTDLWSFFFTESWNKQWEKDQWDVLSLFQLLLLFGENKGSNMYACYVDQSKQTRKTAHWSL